MSPAPPKPAVLGMRRNRAVCPGLFGNSAALRVCRCCPGMELKFHAGQDASQQEPQELLVAWVFLVCPHLFL